MPRRARVVSRVNIACSYVVQHVVQHAFQHASPLSILVCHHCAGVMPIFSVSFQRSRMPHHRILKLVHFSCVCHPCAWGHANLRTLTCQDVCCPFVVLGDVLSFGSSVRRMISLFSLFHQCGVHTPLSPECQPCVKTLSTPVPSPQTVVGGLYTGRFSDRSQDRVYGSGAGRGAVLQSLLSLLFRLPCLLFLSASWLAGPH